MKKKFLDPEYREHAPEMAVIFWMFVALVLTLALAITCGAFYWLCMVNQ